MRYDEERVKSLWTKRAHKDMPKVKKKTTRKHIFDVFFVTFKPFFACTFQNILETSWKSEITT